MLKLKKILFALLAAALIFPLAACEEEGPIENLGEQTQEAVDESGDALEEAGEETRETFDR